MADAESKLSPDETTVRTAVLHMLTRNDWRLLDADEVTQSVLALLANQPVPHPDRHHAGNGTRQEQARPWRNGRSGGGGGARRDSPIEGAALHVYSKALYAAYANRVDEERQQRAYYELFRYVFRSASHWATDLSYDQHEEIAYHVLAELYFRLGASQETQAPHAVRDPGAFLAVVLQQMKNGVRQWRATTRHWITLTTNDDEHPSGTTLVDSLPTTNGADNPGHTVELNELRSHVIRLYAGALQRHPRARMQLHVVWLHQIEDLDYLAIANQLALTVENVRVLYCRGIKCLRNEPGFRALAAEQDVTVEH